MNPVEKTIQPLTKAQELWLQALESGNYNQTTGALHEQGEGGAPDYFCCLGVACELFPAVSDKDNRIIISELIRDKGKRNVFAYKFSSGGLPESMWKYLGLMDKLGTFKFEVIGYRSLTTLNDNARWSFKQIAEYIRANPENVFWTHS